MRKLNACNEELWEVDSAEAKKRWKSHPADRWRLWSHDEITAALLMGPEEITAIIEAKRSKPGSKLDPKPLFEVKDITDHPLYCANGSHAGCCSGKIEGCRHCGS